MQSRKPGMLVSPGMLMTILGFAMLVSGWLLVIATLALLRPGIARNAFIVAALAVEALGLVLVARAHIARKVDRS
jgi:hypothetical protein